MSCQRCQIFPQRLTFLNVFVKNCDVRLIILILIAATTTTILPIIQCAKLENPQIRLLINDDDLLQEKSNIHEAGGGGGGGAAAAHDNSGEHFNLYRSELKRLSYETIHRILRDENEPSYRREDTELRYYQKRSPSYEETHQLIKRDLKKEQEDLVVSLRNKNLTEFLLNPTIEKQLRTASHLDLSDNRLSSLNTSLLVKYSHTLTALNLKRNSFTFIPLSEQSSLKTLNLNENLIKSSSLPSNIYLRNLYLSSNYIEYLSNIKLSLLKNLESLDISYNRLKNSESSFFAQRMHNLKHLNLANNQLHSIYRETFYNLLSLNTLLLSHNNISDIDYETFLALPNLQYLDLSFNRLRGKSIRALQGITGLVALNIAYNPEIGPYMQEFVASWSLKELDASGTGLCQIPAALAQSVRSLKLTHNWLKVITCGDLDSYPLLQYLDLSYSHIEHIEDDAMGRLEILEILMLDHNQLKKIPYSLPVSLEHLFLQNNDIMEIPQQAFQGLNNLKTLDLSHNKLMYLPDIALPKLLTLNLQSAEIKGINQGIVHTLPKLNDLMLEDNPIKCSDLLGIAEWASTCRLRAGKGEEQQEQEEREEGEEEEENNEESGELKMTQLRKKFERMHNFYEKFGLEYTNENQSLLNSFKEPSCVKDILRVQQQLVNTNNDKEVQRDVEGKSLNLLTSSSLMQNEPMLKQENLTEPHKVKTTTTTNKEEKLENFNQNSMISRTVLAASTAMKTLKENNKTDADVDADDIKNAIQQQQQQEGGQQQRKDDAVKTITMENYVKTTAKVAANTRITVEKETAASFSSAASSSSSATMQSSIINEKQTFNTTTKTLNNAAEATATITTTDIKPQQQKQQHQHKTQVDEVEFVVKPRFINEMKTFDHLTATAATTTTTASSTKDEIAAIGNTQTQTFQNMTEVATESAAGPATTQHTAKDAVVKITSKTLQIDKIHQEMVEEEKKHKERNVENLSKEANKEMTAVLQQESTTFVKAINSKQQQRHYEPTDTKTTTMGVETSTQQQQHYGKEEQDATAATTTDIKPQINLLIEKQQQHEIKTKIATTKEIKSLTTKPTTITTTTTITPGIATAATIINEPTIATKMDIITLKSPTEIAANLNKPNKKLKEFTNNNNSNSQQNSNNPINILQHTTKTAATTATPTMMTPSMKSQTNSTIVINKAMTTATQSTTTAAILKTSTIEVASTTTETAAVKDKDLASNYNDNDNNRLTTTTTIPTSTTTNNTPNPTSTTLETTTKTSSSSSIIKNITSNNNNIENNKVLVTLDITTPFTTNIVHQTDNIITGDQQQHEQRQQQLQHLSQQDDNVLLYPSLQKDVNVKCMQSNSNECNTNNRPQRQQQHEQQDVQEEEDIGTQPTMLETKEMTATTTTEKPTATAAATTTLLPVIHKHEPLQLLVKDRHLIGTPLLMHKGENLMVTADELILPQITATTTNQQQHEAMVVGLNGSTDKGQPNSNNPNNNRHNNKEQQHDNIETATEAKNNKHILDKSQQHKQQQQQLKENEPKIHNSNVHNDDDTDYDETEDNNNKKGQQMQQQQQHHHQQQDDNNNNKFKKSNFDLKTKKPSLTMKKMTIITKQHVPTTQSHTHGDGHEQQQQQQHLPQESKENEVHQRQFDNTHYQELKPITKKTPQPEKEEDTTVHNLKHSTVNTPISNKQAMLLKEPHTFQHEHELLIQQILQDQQAESHDRHSKTEQWSDLRKSESKENHPGIILLVSSGLFLVLLLGLMHVYRCDMPWRRNSPIHNLRPHQSHNSSLEDDSHSFLSYSEGMQKWHHSTRLEAPYNSPLHNLHVRELQKTSATERPATVKSMASSFKPIRSSALLTNTTRSLSQSSTTSTSTQSPSSSAILDDETFYIEMTPDSGQMAHSLQSELLPMELLNMISTSQEYKETIVDTQQPIMEDDSLQQHNYQHQQHEQQPQYQQKQHHHVTPFKATSTTTSCSSNSSTTSFNNKPHANSRKFGLW